MSEREFRFNESVDVHPLEGRLGNFSVRAVRGVVAITLLVDETDVEIAFRTEDARCLLAVLSRAVAASAEDA